MFLFLNIWSHYLLDSYLNSCHKPPYFIPLCMLPKYKKTNTQARVLNWIDSEKDNFNMLSKVTKTKKLLMNGNSKTAFNLPIKDLCCIKNSSTNIKNEMEMVSAYGVI